MVSSWSIMNYLRAANSILAPVASYGSKSKLTAKGPSLHTFINSSSCKILGIFINSISLTLWRRQILDKGYSFIQNMLLQRWPRSTTFFYVSKQFSATSNYFLQIRTIFYISQLLSLNHNFFLEIATNFYNLAIFFSANHNFFL